MASKKKMATTIPKGKGADAVKNVERQSSFTHYELGTEEKLEREFSFSSFDESIDGRDLDGINQERRYSFASFSSGSEGPPVQENVEMPQKISKKAPISKKRVASFAPPSAPPPPPAPPPSSKKFSEVPDYLKWAVSNENKPKIAAADLLASKQRLRHTKPREPVNLDRTNLFDKFKIEDHLCMYLVMDHLESKITEWSQIQVLNLAGVEQVTDMFFLAMKFQQVRLPGLSSLTLTGCHNITDEGIRWLSDMPNLNLDEITLKGCKHLTTRSIFRLFGRHSPPNFIDLASTSCGFFPSHLPAKYISQVNLKGCPLISPPYDDYSKRTASSLIDKTLESYNTYKLLVLHDPESTPKTGLFTKQPLDADHVLSVQRDWVLNTGADQKSSKMCYNVYEFFTGKGCENWVLSNGCVIVLPFSNTDDITAKRLASQIMSVIGQYPENAFVLADLSPVSDDKATPMLDKVKEILKGLADYIAGSRTYRSQEDKWVLTEHNFDDQIQMGLNQSLFDSLTQLLVSHQELLCTVSLAKDQEHSFLKTATEHLGVVFPWHQVQMLSLTIRAFDVILKTGKNMPLVSSLSDIKKACPVDIKFTFNPRSGYSEIGMALEVLHDKGAVVYFPNMSRKPAVQNIESLVNLVRLGGIMPHRVDIPGLGPETPCWRRDDFKAFYKNLSDEQINLFLDVLTEQGLVFRFPCSLKDPKFKDTLVYVMSEDLPKDPDTPVDEIWLPDLQTGFVQRDAYLTFPCLPHWLFPCFLRKLQETSQIVLMWKSGLLMRQGPVMVLVELLTNEISQDLPAIVISARVADSKLFDTLFITFNNVKTILEAMMHSRRVFAVKTICCKICNPTKNRRHALSAEHNCCHVKEMDVKVSENVIKCRKKEKEVMITKQEFVGSDLTPQEHVPNHCDMTLLTPADNNTMSMSARCYLCNNCSLRGMNCKNNLRNGISSKHCSCNNELKLCAYCGVCKDCLQTLSNAHATVQPCFRGKLSNLATVKRAGSNLSFSTENGSYTFPDPLNLLHCNRLGICMNRGCHYTVTITSPNHRLEYMTGEGKIHVDGEQKDVDTKDKLDCKMNDILDFELDVVETGGIMTQVLKISRNSEMIFWMKHTDSNATVTITPNKPGNILIYTPNLMRMEEIDTTKEDVFQDGVLKCCGPFPTVIERQMSIMYPTVENMLFKNHVVDFTGSTGVLLPDTVTWKNVLYPSLQTLIGQQTYHPLCMTRSNTGMETEDSHDEWLRINLIHLVNATGYNLDSEAAKISAHLIWGWHCLLIHYPQLDLPPYDLLLPELASNPDKKYNNIRVGKGLQEVLRIAAIYMVSSFDKEHFGLAKFKKRSTFDEIALELQLSVEKNGEKTGLLPIESSMVPGRMLYICPGHAACWQIGLELSDIPIDLFQGYSNFMTSIKLPNNHLTSIPPEVFLNLPHLLKIDVSENFLDSLPETIGQCVNLHYLDLAENNLLDLPASLSNCKRICRIDISENRMEVLPPVLVEMPGLRRLIANDLLLTSLPENIGDMPILDVLYMNGNCLSKLPKSFAKLQKLKELSLAGVMWMKNKARQFHSRSYFETFLEGRGIKRWMAALPDVEKVNDDDVFQLFDIDSSGTLDTKEIARLNASLFSIFPRFGYKGIDPPDDNTPSGFPEEILALKNLTYLNLQYQGIVHIPAGIQNLEKLDNLTLAFNPNLLSIAAEAGRCPLKRLIMEECPLLKTPPKEIRERGFNTTYAYLKRLLTGSVDCKRTKLMLVGLGGAGKTSLVKALMSSMHEGSNLTGADSITDGIDICTWDVDYKGDTVSYSVWDFAGQTVYYNTHQFFLSDRAVYLLLWNIRLGHEHAGLNFWLNSITVHAPKAPIFVVGTHTDQMTKVELPMDEMSQTYHQIEGFHFVSSKDGKGIPDLKEALFKATLQQEYMGEKIPQAWLQFESIITKEKVTNSKDVLSYKEVETLATEVGIVDSVEVAQSIQFLHDLGSVQHFQNEYLHKHVVINPQWIVDVMACVVSVKQTFIQDGHLNHSDIQTVWKDYPNMCDWLLKLTEQFDLTYQLEGEKCNIVPCLLPEKRPEFKWPEMNKDEGIYETTMIYRFDYLPAGLFNRGQVRLHGYSEDSFIWKRGSFLKKNGQIALIQQIKDSELNVRVQGMKPDNLLFFIHEVFEGLINESFHGVAYDYEIPCPDCTKQYVKDPHMFKASGIRRALELKAPFLQCQKYFHTAPVLSLQGTLAPDTNSDFEVHLDQDVNNLQHMQNEMAVDIFLSYCIKDAPGDKSKVIHPATVHADLEKAGYSCYFPEGKDLISRENMAKRIVHASVFLVFISNNYAANDVCCDMFKYVINTMRKPTIVVAVGENFDWKQSPTLGVFVADLVFVNMINSKKDVYKTKFAELLTTLQKNEQLSLTRPETSNSCFISYSWVNSRMAVDSGTRELAGAVGQVDPRELKNYLEEHGVGCWIDVEQVNVNDQLFSRIAKGMSEARIMVACVSDEYAESKTCCKELRFALQLGLPLVIAVVGTGDQWKRTEVGFHSLSFPTINFQSHNDNACSDLLKLVQKHMLSERKEDAEEEKRKKNKANEEKANTSFQEMYELAQRKFLRQIASYASAQDLGNYPHLFVLDISPTHSKKTNSEEDSTVELDYDSVKNKGFWVNAYTMCECEQGWHSVCDPIEMRFRFDVVQLEEYASYLARITMVMRHDPNFALSLYNSKAGQHYLKLIQELAMKNTNNFQTNYHNLRQLVFDLDIKGEKGKLNRCRMPSGKTSWLCEKHSKDMKCTVLSDKVTEIKHKVTNQPWLEAMVDCLRIEQKHPFKFKSIKKAKRLVKALKVDDVERDSIRHTMSRSSSNLGKSAALEAVKKEVLKELNLEELAPKETKSPPKKSGKKTVGFITTPTASIEDLKKQELSSQLPDDLQDQDQEKEKEQEKAIDQKEVEQTGKESKDEKRVTPSPTPQAKDINPAPTSESKEINPVPTPQAKESDHAPTPETKENNTASSSSQKTQESVPEKTPFIQQTKSGDKTEPAKIQRNGPQSQSKPAEKSKACVIV
ncbi:uncharacterized protein LOC110455055 [Mizuhopecten yessoensis]|uniref:uncharacterized protein LOC110455055 n=1 Tax=Mizuhopecten yessoensis TaxID=6573 RepID=UPI000B45D506|nr:uncharacterized protein LOC110455055 [Mizuhopecten yessoensis]